MISRRGFLTGLAATVAAPAVITRPGILMPLRGLVMPTEVVLGYTLTGVNQFGDLVRWFPATGEWEWGVPKKKAPGAAQWFLLLGPPS